MQPCALRTPLASESAFLAGKVSTAVGAVPPESSINAARAPDNSTSRVSHQAPHTMAFLGPIGPVLLHGSGDPGNVWSFSKGSAAAAIEGPRPRAHERLTSVRSLKRAVLTASPRRSASTLYCDKIDAALLYFPTLRLAARHSTLRAEMGAGTSD